MPVETQVRHSICRWAETVRVYPERVCVGTIAPPSVRESPVTGTSINNTPFHTIGATRELPRIEVIVVSQNSVEQPERHIPYTCHECSLPYQCLMYFMPVFYITLSFPLHLNLIYPYECPDLKSSYFIDHCANRTLVSTIYIHIIYIIVYYNFKYLKKMFF